MRRGGGRRGVRQCLYLEGGDGPHVVDALLDSLVQGVRLVLARDQNQYLATQRGRQQAPAVIGLMYG